MGGEFHEALETLRDDLKKELKYHVGRRLFFGPDGIVKLDEILNNRQFLQKFFEEFIQREKNRILKRLNEIQKLGDIEQKLEDIEKSLEKIKRKQRELEEELEKIKMRRRKLKEELKGLEVKAYLILRKDAALEEYLKNRILRTVEEDAMLKNFLGKLKMDVEEYLKKHLKNILEGVKRDMISYIIIPQIRRDPIVLVNRGLISEDTYKLIEPYHKKYEHIIEEINKIEDEKNGIENKKRRLENKKEKLEEWKRTLLCLKDDLPLEQKKLEKIELIEAQRDMNKIQEFIKDLIREIRGERVNEWEIPDHYIFGDDDVLS